MDYFITKWTKDPYSKMCYSYVPIGVDGDAYDIMSQDVASKVYFAGEVSICLHAHVLDTTFIYISTSVLGNPSITLNGRLN